MACLISVIVGHHGVYGCAGGIFDGFCSQRLSSDQHIGLSGSSDCSSDSLSPGCCLSHGTTSRTFIIDTQIDRTSRACKKKRERQALELTPNPWQIHRAILGDKQVLRSCRVGPSSMSEYSSLIDSPGSILVHTQ